MYHGRSRLVKVVAANQKSDSSFYSTKPSIHPSDAASTLHHQDHYQSVAIAELLPLYSKLTRGIQFVLVLLHWMVMAYLSTIAYDIC